MSEFYTPVHGDQINGSPATINRYITAILAQGAHFQFVDGETIEVLVPGAGQAVVTSLGDTVVAAKPEAPAPAPVEVEIAVEPAEEVKVSVDGDLLPDVEVAVEVEVPKPTRGRKPKAAPAPDAEVEAVEGE